MENFKEKIDGLERAGMISHLEQAGILDRTEIEAMEKTLELDPANVLTKMRTIAERLAKRLHVHYFPENTDILDFKGTLDSLIDNEILQSPISDYFHSLRLIGNKAVHAKKGSGDAGTTLKLGKDDVGIYIQIFIRIIEWFVNEQLEKILSRENDIVADNKEDLEEFNGISLSRVEANALKILEGKIKKRFVLDTSYKEPKKFHGTFDHTTRKIHIQDAHVLALDLNDCKLKDVPIEIKQFTHMQALVLNKNNIIEIPGWMLDIISLTNLCINQNPVMNFDILKKMPNLSTIHVSSKIYNKYKKDFLSTNKKLDNDNIGPSTSTFVIAEVTSILIVGFLLIIDFCLDPDSYFMLKWLEANGFILGALGIDCLIVGIKNAVKSSKIKPIYDGINAIEQDILLRIRNKTNKQILFSTQNGSVTSLAISLPEFATIPDDVKELASLTSFFVNANMLFELPPWLVELTSLEYLDIHGNLLDQIPDILLNLNHLKKVVIRAKLLRTEKARALRKKGVKVTSLQSYFTACMISCFILIYLVPFDITVDFSVSCIIVFLITCIIIYIIIDYFPKDNKKRESL